RLLVSLGNTSSDMMIKESWGVFIGLNFILVFQMYGALSELPFPPDGIPGSGLPIGREAEPIPTPGTGCRADCSDPGKRTSSPFHSPGGHPEANNHSY